MKSKEAEKVTKRETYQEKVKETTAGGKGRKQLLDIRAFIIQGDVGTTKVIRDITNMKITK